MELSDLKPRRTCFKVRIGGQKTKLYFRPFTLRDEAWMQDNFSEEDLKNILFCKSNIKKIAKILWHQLEVKSKKKILSANLKFQDLDENGNIIDVNPKAADRLIGIISSQELKNGLEAFAECRGINAALINAAMNEEADPKKKLTGPTFLTLSRLNTATALSKYFQ